MDKDALQINLTMMYSFDNHEWNWVDSYAAREGLSIDVLTSRKESTFNELLNSPASYVYHNEKKKAIEEGHYIPDRTDHIHKNKGSIVCWRISVSLDGKRNLGSLVVSISSYGYEFAENDSREISGNESMALLFDLFEEPLVQRFIYFRLLDKQYVQADIRAQGDSGQPVAPLIVA